MHPAGIHFRFSSAFAEVCRTKASGVAMEDNSNRSKTESRLSTDPAFRRSCMRSSKMPSFKVVYMPCTNKWSNEAKLIMDHLFVTTVSLLRHTCMANKELLGASRYLRRL